MRVGVEIPIDHGSLPKRFDSCLSLCLGGKRIAGSTPVASLLDHPIADDDNDAINAAYRARLLAQDWGLYRTLQLNTARVRQTAKELPVASETIEQRLDQLCERTEAQPKSLTWRLRTCVGDRRSWYELPEEVRQPYQAE